MKKITSPTASAESTGTLAAPAKKAARKTAAKKAATASSPAAEAPSPAAPAPAKKTARASSAAATAAIILPVAPPEPAPAKAPRKTAAKKAASARTTITTTESQPAPAPKAPAKKASSKSAAAAAAAAAAAFQQPELPISTPASAPVSAPAAAQSPRDSAPSAFQDSGEPAPKTRAPRKSVRKIAGALSGPANTQSEAPFPLFPQAGPAPAETAPSAPPDSDFRPRPRDYTPPAPESDYHPDQNRFESPPPRQERPPYRDPRAPRPPRDAQDPRHNPAPRPQRDPRDQPRDPRDQRPPLDGQPASGSPSPDGAPPPYRQSQYPPRQQRPYPPREPLDGSPTDARPASANPPAPGIPNTELGPDGEPRRLTKWERWKLRKEKFKQQKQQRYLERTGRAPGPPGQTPDAENPDRRERDPRFDSRPDARPDPRGEPRPWEPRPPRPEIPLGPPEDCAGLLELTDKGFAFLRPKDRGFVPSPTDPFVSAELVRQHGLREGVWVEGVMQRGGRGLQVTQLKKVNGLEPNAYRTLPLFEELTAINPNKRYILETDAKRHTTRLIDFISPIGRGQRGLIVAPPRAGKTTFLQHIAEAVLHNYEDVKVIVLLVDERPEEVTEIARALPGAEIMASSNDQDPRNHIRMANLAIERAKRLVEAGQHVFMLLDSITRLARGFNNSMRGGGGGKAMSGGLDSRALEAPRRLFAAARNTREAGSLTIMATALVETNNKGDDLIFQEFKGTGNMELVLDRKISQAYVYPAVDIFKSGTRREELLLPAHQLEKVHLIRRGLSGHRPQEAVERLLQVMGKYNNNNQMLIEIKARGE